MSSASRVEQVVRSAWERRCLVVAIERAAVAAVVVFASIIVMLLVGTQILNWYWLLLLAVAGTSIAAYQVHQRMLGHYRIAQLLDYRLKLADSLSTAWYLVSQPNRTPEPVANFQIATAEKAADAVNVASAFPLSGQRLWSVAGGLAAVALGLFAIRYLVTDTLSLQRPLITFHLGEVFERAGNGPAEQREHADALGADERGDRASSQTDSQKDAKAPPRIDPPQLGKPDGSSNGANQTQQAEMREDDKDAASKEGKEGAGSSAQARAGEKSSEDSGKTPQSDKPSPNDQANSPQSSTGLMDRMKDALSSMLAKMRQNQNQPEENQRAAQDRQAQQENSAGKEENSNARKNSANNDTSDQQQSAEGQAQGQTKEKTRAGQGRSSDQASDKSKSDSHAGIGSQDGDKELKDAEQLKAMGKLAEIIGKRSENVTGDMMVENPSGKQHLQTSYSQRMGQHADLGGEINRDEIPLMYQRYVREYMEQVRKPARKHVRPAS